MLKEKNKELAVFWDGIRRNGDQVYDADMHIGLLYDVFSKGGTVKHYIIKIGIVEKTFYRWVNRHPEFKVAYEMARNIAMLLWEEMPLNDKNLNISYWKKIMRVRYGYGRVKVDLDLSGDPEDNINKIIDGVNSGQIYPDEAEALSRLVAKKIKARDSKEMTGIYSSMNGDQKVAALEKLMAIHGVFDSQDDKPAELNHVTQSDESIGEPERKLLDC